MVIGIHASELRAAALGVQSLQDGGLVSTRLGWWRWDVVEEGRPAQSQTEQWCGGATASVAARFRRWCKGGEAMGRL